MKDTYLMQLALGLTPPWSVTGSDFDAGHWFDMQSYTVEDLGRAAAYSARAAALAEIGRASCRERV